MVRLVVSCPIEIGAIPRASRTCNNYHEPVIDCNIYLVANRSQVTPFFREWIAPTHDAHTHAHAHARAYTRTRYDTRTEREQSENTVLW